jgi:hypothetical protein
MVDKELEKPCAHLVCECTVMGDEEYCSPHCETAPDDEISCSCGHAVCLAGKIGSATA